MSEQEPLCCLPLSRELRNALIVCSSPLRRVDRLNSPRHCQRAMIDDCPLDGPYQNAKEIGTGIDSSQLMDGPS